MVKQRWKHDIGVDRRGPATVRQLQCRYISGELDSNTRKVPPRHSLHLLSVAAEVPDHDTCPVFRANSVQPPSKPAKELNQSVLEVDATDQVHRKFCAIKLINATLRIEVFFYAGCRSPQAKRHAIWQPHTRWIPRLR